LLLTLLLILPDTSEGGAVNLEDSCERRVFAYPCPTKSFGDDTVVCSEIACEPLLSSYTESCPLTGPYLAFGEGCCGGAAVLATNRLCEVKRYVSQRLVSGCTVVGCSMCMGGEGYKQCISQGCYGDPNYEWPAKAFEQYTDNGNICPSYDKTLVVTSSAPPNSISVLLPGISLAVALLISNATPLRC